MKSSPLARPFMGVFGDCKAAVTHTGLRWRSRADHFDETGWGRGYPPANSASHLQTCSRCPEYTSSDETPPRSFHSRCSAPRSAFKRPPFQEALSKNKKKSSSFIHQGPDPPRSASGHPKTYKRLFVLYSFFTLRLSLSFFKHIRSSSFKL